MEDIFGLYLGIMKHELDTIICRAYIGGSI